MKGVFVDLGVDLHRRLKMAAASRLLSMRAFLILILTQWLDSNEQN